VGLFEEGCVLQVDEDPPDVPQITDLASGPDADGDGLDDILLADERGSSDALGAGRVWLRQSTTGEVIDIVTGGTNRQGLGSRLLLVPDLNGDGLSDAVVSSDRSHTDLDRERLPRPDPGIVVVVSGLGEELYRLEGEEPCRAFGYRIAGGRDVDGDGLSDLIIADPGCFIWSDPSDRSIPVSSFDGRVTLVSGATGRELRSWSAQTGGHEYGMSFVGFVDDQDGDDVADVAIVSGRGLNRHTIVELFSSGTGELLKEMDATAHGRIYEIADLDGDGELDILAVSRDTTLVRSVFSISPEVVVLGPAALAVASIPSETRLRIAIMGRFEFLQVLDESGLVSFTGPTNREGFAILRDVNGDNTFDIVIGTTLAETGAKLHWLYSGNVSP